MEYKLETKVPIESEKRQKLIKFHDWFVLNGGEVNKVKIRHTTDIERGVFATRNINQNEAILFCPFDLLYRPGLGRETIEGKNILKAPLASS